MPQRRVTRDSATLGIVNEDGGIGYLSPPQIDDDEHGSEPEQRTRFARDRVALPHCAVRSSCGWFAQARADACRACPLAAAGATTG